MSLLYFDSSYASQVGKRHGRVEVFYSLIRVALVVTERRANATTATIVNTILLSLLCAYAFREQPFFNHRLNDLRFGIYGGAFALSLSTLLYSVIDGDNSVALIGAGLGVSLFGAIGSYFLNLKAVEFICDKIYSNLKQYDLVIARSLGEERPQADGLENVRKSYAELLYQNTGDIVKRRAVVAKIGVFPASHYPDIAARFIRKAYMDKDAVTLANRLLEIAVLQFPSSSSVHLQYLGYINCYLTFLRGMYRILETFSNPLGRPSKRIVFDAFEV